MASPIHVCRAALLCAAALATTDVFAQAEQRESGYVPQPAARTIYLIRHGHYDADPQADPELGPGISALGVAQARLLGARLAQVRDFDQLHVSPMQRAQDTAASLLPSLPGTATQTLADLRECTPTPRRRGAVSDVEPAEQARCQAQLERVFSAHFKPAVGSERRELMVCHGNVIRYLITRALGVDSEAWLEMSVGHSSISQIRIEADGGYKVIAVGDVGHLPANLHSGASGDPDTDLLVTQGPRASREQLAQTLELFLRGASNNDAQIHDDFWHPDLVYTSSSGTRFGKAELMRSVRSAEPSQQSGPSYSAEAVDIRLYGDVAVLAFTLVAAGAGDAPEQRYFNTGTFKRVRNSWQAVAWQATKIPSAEP